MRNDGLYAHSTSGSSRTISSIFMSKHRNTIEPPFEIHLDTDKYYDMLQKAIQDDVNHERACCVSFARLPCPGYLGMVWTESILSSETPPSRVHRPKNRSLPSGAMRGESSEPWFIFLSLQIQSKIPAVFRH